MTAHSNPLGVSDRRRTLARSDEPPGAILLRTSWHANSIVRMTDDEHAGAFRPNGTGGYDKDNVDGFLDLVEQDLARLAEENVDLKAALEGRDVLIAGLRSELAKYKGDAE